MATVLYITAHPRDDERSYSMTVGKEFLQVYRSTNPQDEIVHLDLFKMDLPQHDGDILDARDKLRQGVSFDQLTPAEQSKFGRILQVIEQVVAADKYILVSPIWNFSYPSVMKNFLDAIVLPGMTVKYNSDGTRTVALSGKKAVHIQASGSILSPGSGGAYADDEMGHRHIKAILNFLGLTDFQGIFVEGMQEFADRAEEFKEKALREARQVAENF
ncbi:NAD(P)H-dependent oxidoreductase [Paenibacillus filicis]|uniref:FMN dependent NADH:quinone oxidoreductase n=1 Tax=Paenibacillus filicis TaxID=669464 RepID=A0ABU9DUR6_9BACL